MKNNDKIIAEFLIERDFFDKEWYQGLYPDLKKDVNLDLEHHFYHWGIKENRSPHPLIDPDYYLITEPEIKQKKITALTHFFSHGLYEGRTISPFIEKENVAGSVKPSVLDPTSYLRYLKKATTEKNNPFRYFLKDSSERDFKIDEKIKNIVLQKHNFSEILSSIIIVNRNSISEEPIYFYQCLRNFFLSGTQNAVFSKTDLIDYDFIRRKSGLTNENPLIHYLSHFKEKPLWCNLYFNANFIYKKYQDLMDDKDPMSFYLEKGDRSIWLNSHTEESFIKENYKNLLKPFKSINHFILKFAGEDWFNPSKNFSTRYYKEKYFSQNKTEVPLAHFLHTGKSIPYSPFPNDPISFYKNDHPKKVKFEDEYNNSKSPEVTIIIPTYNDDYYILNCLNSIYSTSSKKSFKVIVADDSTQKTYRTKLKAETKIYPNLIVHGNEKNLGFLKNCNNIAKQIDTEYILFLNNDTIVTDHFLDHLFVPFDQSQNVGLTGSKLIYSNGLLQEAGGIIWETGQPANYGNQSDPFHPNYSYRREADYISGACFLLKTETFKTVSGFDEKYAPAYFEDTDLCLKIKNQGLRVIYCPESVVIHFEGISYGNHTENPSTELQENNAATFFEKWKPNLSNHGSPGDFSLKTVNRSRKGHLIVVDEEIPMPDKDSGSVTAFGILKILSELGYSITFIPHNLQAPIEYRKPLQNFGIRVLYNPYYTQIDELLKTELKYADIVWASRVTIAKKVWDIITYHEYETKFIFDTVDLHHLRLERQSVITQDGSIMEKSRELKILEINLIENSDLTLLVSHFEKDYLLKEIGPFPNIVLPLLYDEYTPTNTYSQRRNIAFIGSFRHDPNLDAVKFFLKEIWPLFQKDNPEVEFHIIGSYPEKLNEIEKDPFVRIVGFVKDLEHYLESIRLTIAPLRFGSGVKGKIGNSMRLGVPIVATPIAVEGMNLKENYHVFLGESPLEFSQAMNRLYNNEEIWNQLSKQGKEFAYHHYSFKSWKSSLEKHLNSLT